MEKSKRKFLLIRHGESEFNYTRENSIDGLSAFYNKSLTDCAITEKGRTQCLLANEKVQKFPISIVLVSPLKRALQTAQNIFKNHPDKPKLYVVPYLRERVSATCDLSTVDFDEPNKEFEDCDWSYMKKIYADKKNYWLAEELSQIKGIPELIAETKKEEQIHKFSDKIESLIKSSEGKEKDKLEKVKDFQRSIDKLMDFIKQIKENEGIENNKYIAIVCHFGTLKFLMKTMDDKLSNVVFNNCEIKEVEY